MMNKRTRLIKCWSQAVVLFAALSTIFPLMKPRQVLRGLRRQKIAAPEKKILMATFIFGTDNPYVQMFAESARHSGIDVAIVGSPAPSFPLPPNVHHIPITWEKFVDRVSDRVFKGQRLPSLRKANGYKVIDFKPLFAHLFPERVEGYDWWGHLDNDIILGNVRRFIAPEMLEQYDVVCGVNATENNVIRTWGPFTLYRNSKLTNELFRLAQHPLKKLYDTTKHHYLDEWGMGGGNEGRAKLFNSTMSGILTHHHERLGIRVYHEDIPIAWDGGCKAMDLDCKKCILTMPPHFPQRLTEIIKSPVCTDDDCQQDVLLCHYQHGKSSLKKSLLKDPQRGMDLIKDGRFAITSSEGFSPIE